MKSALRGALIEVAALLVLTSCASDGGAADESGSSGSSGDADASTGAVTATGEPGQTGGSTGPVTTGEPTSTNGTGATADPGDTGDTGETGGSDDTGEPAGSRCEQTAEMITCPKQTIELGPWMRDVHWQVPLGEPPAGGWPVVLMFQGSFFSAEVTWTAAAILPFGAYNQTLVVKTLLDHGYAVITPETKLDGGTFWDTNVPPYSLAWETSEDHQLMLAIFAAIADGTFGPLALDRWFATGVSSGGYMTSRMAVSYPGKFRSLAIAAASYATCSGPLCDVPEQDPDHPPTLFLHGELDPTVPLATAVEYRDRLAAVGVDTRLVTDPAEGHGWIPAAPAEVLQWFAGHP